MAGGRSPYAPTPTEAAAYAYEMEASGGTNGGGPRGGSAMGGYDGRGPGGQGSRQGYYPNEEEAHFGPPGTGSGFAEYEKYGDVQGGGDYYAPPPQRGGRGPAAQPSQQDGWYRGPGGMAQGLGAVSPGGYVEDEYGVTAFSDEEADELDSRMSRGQGGADAHARTKSLLRYNELERERSRRRQTIVKNKTGSKMFPGKLKLSMMNTGLIPIKKGKGRYFATIFCM
jgi:hypothetical protein